MASLTVTTAAIRAMFVAMGYKAAKDWNAKRLELKLTPDKFQDLIDGGKEPEAEAELYAKVVAAIEAGEEITLEDGETSAETATEAAPKKGKGKKGNKTSSSNGHASSNGKGKKGAPQKAGADKGPGIVASILEYLQAANSKKPLTKNDIVEKLAKRFPDRNAESMAKTVNVQVPSRLAKEKKVTIDKNENGYWAK